jgi:hypothetical protein
MVEQAVSLDLVATLALVGAVILIAALLSGVVEQSGIPQVAIFLALGAALGPACGCSRSRSTPRRCAWSPRSRTP